MSYQRADFTPLRELGYGIGFHWTSETMPREGRALGFAEAVDNFDVDAFVSQAAATGAGYVLFTTTHLTHHLACPNPEVERLILGRSTRRDLLMEMADGLADAGMGFVLYYNHGIKKTASMIQDPEWQAAAGSLMPDLTTYYENHCRLIGWMGKHYGPKLKAWWFDGAREFATRPGVPWAEMVQAAKAGHPERLVCYNSGIEENGYELVAPYQDCWAGESTSLDFRPSGEATPAGLPWHAFLSWHPARNARGEPKKTRAARWLMDPVSRGLQWPPPDPKRVVDYLQAFHDCSGVVTFNLLCYQDGSALETDLEVMKEVKAVYRD